MRFSIISILFCFSLILNVPGNACTSFCMDTPDGPIFACNLDLMIPGDGLVFVNQRGIAKEGYMESETGKKANWISKYGSVSFNLAGREFPWSGINEAGLAMCTLQLMASKCAEDNSKPPMGEGYLVQYVLDQCASADEAIAAIAKVQPSAKECTSHYLITDENGETAAIEFLDGEYIFHSGADLPVKAMSNMPYGRALEAYKRGGPKWWWSNPGQSAERFSAAEERKKSFDAKRDSCSTTYAFTTLRKVVAADHTKWNIVFDLKSREVWYRSLRSPAVKHISLSAFDYSCDRPLLMLDINTSLEGVVEEHFRPYNHEVNLELFAVFCARWGIDISPEDAAALMDFFDAFECVH